MLSILPWDCLKAASEREFVKAVICKKLNVFLPKLLTQNRAVLNGYYKEKNKAKQTKTVHWSSPTPFHAPQSKPLSLPVLVPISVFPNSMVTFALPVRHYKLISQLKMNICFCFICLPSPLLIYTFFFCLLFKLISSTFWLGQYLVYNLL